MNYDQYQQLYSAAKAQIADRVAKIQPRAGNGASVNGMGISIEVPAGEEDVGVADIKQYFVLAWLGETRDFNSAAEFPVSPSGAVNMAYPVEPNEPLNLTLQFVGAQSGVYYFPFPVRVTLVQYKQFTQEEGYREDPMRTVTVDLRRDPVTTVFYNDITEFRTQIVRLTKLVRI